RFLGALRGRAKGGENLAGLSVDEVRRANDASAESLSHRLMSQADAEHRSFAREMANQVERDPRVIGRAWPWREHDPLGRQIFNLLDRDPVVAGDLDVARDRQIGAELAQMLHEVVGE